MNHQNKVRSIAMGAVVLGAVMSIVLSLIFAAVVAWLIHMQIIGENSIGAASAFSVALASFFGAMAATAGNKDRALAICGIMAAILYLGLVSAGIAIFEGKTQGLGVGAIMVTAGYGLGAAMRILPKKAGGKRKYKYRFR